MDQVVRSSAAYEVSEFIHNETAPQIHLVQLVEQPLGVGFRHAFVFAQLQCLVEFLPGLSSTVCHGRDGVDRRTASERVVHRYSGSSEWGCVSASSRFRT